MVVAWKMLHCDFLRRFRWLSLASRRTGTGTTFADIQIRWSFASADAVWSFRFVAWLLSSLFIFRSHQKIEDFVIRFLSCYVKFIWNFCILSSEGFLKDWFFVIFELLNHFLCIDGYASNAFFAVSFDLIFDDELIGSMILVGIEIKCLHGFQIHNFLIFSDFDLFGLEGIGWWF